MRTEHRFHFRTNCLKAALNAAFKTALLITFFLACHPAIGQNSFAERAERAGEQELVPPESELNAIPNVNAEKDEAQETVRLKRSIQKQVRETVVPALLDGNEGLFLTAMGRVIAKLDPDELRAVEALGQECGIDSLQRHFVDALIAAIEQGVQKSAPDLKPPAAQFVNTGLAAVIDTEIAELELHRIMQDPLELPDGWRECEELFWQVHVWKNQLENIQRLATFGLAVQDKALNRAIKNEDQATIDVLQTALQAARKVQLTYHNLLEREAELRVSELERAELVLRGDTEFENRLAAAFVLELDGTTLDQIFRDNPSDTFARERLQDPALPDHCAQLLASGREHGEDVIAKSVLLRVGAHWWLRGRYGSGTMAEGLLKSPGAVESEQAMFGLYMPKERPAPVGSYDEEEEGLAPGYDRRHYFTWAVERRDRQISVATRSDTKTEYGAINNSDKTKFW